MEEATTTTARPESVPGVHGASQSDRDRNVYHISNYRWMKIMNALRAGSPLAFRVMTHLWVGIVGFFLCYFTLVGNPVDSKIDSEASAEVSDYQQIQNALLNIIERKQREDTERHSTSVTQNEN